MEKKKRPESAVQFQDIFEKWNDPNERLKRKMLKGREEKLLNKKKDLGY